MWGHRTSLCSSQRAPSSLVSNHSNSLYVCKLNATVSPQNPGMPNSSILRPLDFHISLVLSRPMNVIESTHLVETSIWIEDETKNKQTLWHSRTRVVHPCHNRKSGFHSCCPITTPVSCVPAHPKVFPLRAAWALVRFLLRTGRSRLKMVSWSLSSSDSDIMRLELCSVLLCLMSEMGTDRVDHGRVTKHRKCLKCVEWKIRHLLYLGLSSIFSCSSMLSSIVYLVFFPTLVRLLLNKTHFY